MLSDISQQLASPLREARYLVLHIPPGLGIGNRLLSVVSAFAFALVSKRALLIDWPLDLPQMSEVTPYVPSPSQLRYWLQLFALPDGIEWDFLNFLGGLSPHDLDIVSSLSTSIAFGEEMYQ